jgi:hypothetical protein
VYGTGEIQTLLRKAGKGYVASNHVFHSWGKQQPVAGVSYAVGLNHIRLSNIS